MQGNLHWHPAPFVAPSVNFYQSRTTGPTSPEGIKRNYGIHVPLTLLPTLNLGLGATRSERYTDGHRVYDRNAYQLSAFAILYPDLTAALTSTYNRGNTLRSSEAGETVNVNESMSSTLTFSARLTSKLSCDLVNFYFKSYAPGDTTNYYSTLTIDYRPSDYLRLNLVGDKYWRGTSADELRPRLNLVLLRTRKTRVDINYSGRYTQGQDVIHGFGLLASWDISRIFTLKSQANYSIRDINSWNFLASLYMRF